MSAYEKLCSPHPNNFQIIYPTGTNFWLYTECPRKHRQRLVYCAGRQTDLCSRRNPRPETQGLGAVERRSLRKNGCQFVSIRFGTLIQADMQPFSHLRTLIEMCGITSTLHRPIPVGGEG